MFAVRIARHSGIASTFSVFNSLRRARRVAKYMNGAYRTENYYVEKITGPQIAEGA